MVENITKHFSNVSPIRQIVIVIGASVVLGLITGYILYAKGGGSSPVISQPPSSAQQDIKTFRDFAEGTLVAKPKPKDPNQYVEGTHMLEREGAVPVALTSSVVDLSKYEGKKIKVYGETQKALKEGWLMDVGKVEVVK